MMRISTLDQMSMNDVTELDNAPFIIDGDLKIHFESEENKLEIMDIPVHGAENSEALDKIFSDAAESSITGSIN